MFGVLRGALGRNRASALAGSLRRGSVRVLMRTGSIPAMAGIADAGMRHLFDRVAPDWERIRADPTYRAGFKHALDLLPDGFQPGFVVDLGCGTGIAAELTSSRYPQAIILGIDVSPDMVRLARGLVPGVVFEVGTARDVPVADGTVDLVVALDGVVDLDEVVRMLSADGHVLLAYSRGGTTPIAIPVEVLATRFARHGLAAAADTTGPAHVVHARG